MAIVVSTRYGVVRCSLCVMRLLCFLVIVLSSKSLFWVCFSSIAVVVAGCFYDSSCVSIILSFIENENTINLARE